MKKIDKVRVVIDITATVVYVGCTTSSCHRMEVMCLGALDVPIMKVKRRKMARYSQRFRPPGGGGTPAEALAAEDSLPPLTVVTTVLTMIEVAVYMRWKY